MTSFKFVAIQLFSYVRLLLQSYDCSSPGSSIHGILQAGILEWVVISASRGSFQSKDRTQVSCVSCIASGAFAAEPPET